MKGREVDREKEPDVYKHGPPTPPRPPRGPRSVLNGLKSRCPGAAVCVLVGRSRIKEIILLRNDLIEISKYLNRSKMFAFFFISGQNRILEKRVVIHSFVLFIEMNIDKKKGTCVCNVHVAPFPKHSCLIFSDNTSAFPRSSADFVFPFRRFRDEVIQRQSLTRNRSGPQSSSAANQSLLMIPILPTPDWIHVQFFPEAFGTFDEEIRKERKKKRKLTEGEGEESRVVAGASTDLDCVGGQRAGCVVDVLKCHFTVAQEPALISSHQISSSLWTRDVFKAERLWFCGRMSLYYVTLKEFHKALDMVSETNN
ncbi:hypothetical protein F2P81_006769 [Scophthalmus maximus]|uniref:Uncharacterized protein n=1 Tax=Scophthalmus maximus TaxID=52904 RepID=A0A6A4TDC2_SCOMX|nr:hypothetical protein F2P81_006769 [Scophthalmus maximus]